jgi:hypothetical protein
MLHCISKPWRKHCCQSCSPTWLHHQLHALKHQLHGGNYLLVSHHDHVVYQVAHLHSKSTGIAQYTRPFSTETM